MAGRGGGAGGGGMPTRMIQEGAHYHPSTSALGSDPPKEELGCEPPEGRDQILLLSPE